MKRKPIEDRRRHKGATSAGRRLTVYLPGFIADRLDDHRKKHAYLPSVSTVIARALERFLKAEERRATRK